MRAARVPNSRTSEHDRRARWRTFDDRHGLVMRARVLLPRVRVEAMRPQDGRAFFGHDREVEGGEAGAASRLDVREVQKEGEGARPARRINLLGDPIMV